jgi:hypothetical protein
LQNSTQQDVPSAAGFGWQPQFYLKYNGGECRFPK